MDEAADGDDGVGEVEERVDDVLAALVAALQPIDQRSDLRYGDQGKRGKTT